MNGDDLERARESLFGNEDERSSREYDCLLGGVVLGAILVSLVIIVITGQILAP